MQILSIHRNGHTISIVPKALSRGLELASEAHASCKLAKVELPHLYYYGHTFTLGHTIDVEDDHEPN